MTRHRVVITAIGGNVGQGVLKALRNARHEYLVIGTDMEPLSAGFAFADIYYTTPRTGDKGFEEALSHIRQKHSPEAIYVCSHAELRYFSANKERLEKQLGLRIFVNPLNVVDTGCDKLKTARFLEKAGLPFLETAAADDEAGVKDIINRFGFPVIAKPRIGAASSNVFLVSSHTQLDSARALIPDLIVQRYIPDDDAEYTATTISGPDKKVRATIVLHRYLTQGTTYRTEMAQDRAIIDQIKRNSEALGATHSCNFQFRIVDGTAFVFEINPRFSGTSGIRYLYGFNDAEMVFELFCLNKEIKQPKLRQAVVLRYWNEVNIPGADFQSLRHGEKTHAGQQVILPPTKQPSG